MRSLDRDMRFSFPERCWGAREMRARSARGRAYHTVPRRVNGWNVSSGPRTGRLPEREGEPGRPRPGPRLRSVDGLPRPFALVLAEAVVEFPAAAAQFRGGCGAGA